MHGNKATKKYEEVVEASAEQNTEENKVTKENLENQKLWIFNNNNCVIDMTIPEPIVGGKPIGNGDFTISYAWSIPPGRV
jgi:hypothetical protein